MPESLIHGLAAVLRLVPAAEVLKQTTIWEDKTHRGRRRCEGGVLWLWVGGREGWQLRNNHRWLPHTLMQPVNKRHMSSLCERNTALCFCIAQSTRSVKRRLKSLIYVSQLLQHWGKRLMWCHLLSTCLFWSLRTDGSDYWITREFKRKEVFFFFSQVHDVREAYLYLLDTSAAGSLWRIQW